jgi:hypothetical protein
VGNPEVAPVFEEVAHPLNFRGKTRSGCAPTGGFEKLKRTLPDEIRSQRLAAPAPSR